MRSDLAQASFQINREIARTPTHAVYEAFDPEEGSAFGVAMEPSQSHSKRARTGALSTRLALVSHENLLPMRQHDCHGKGHLIFELPSSTLAAELAVHPYPPARVATLAAELAGALGRLHRVGIRLGTLHPGYVGMDESGRAWLSPWPLAQPPPGWGGEEAWSAPECAAGGPPTIAGDIWSLGAVLLSSLVGPGPGSLPDKDATAMAEHLRHSVDQELVTVIRRSMAENPIRRYPTADRMGAALQVRSTERVHAGAPGASGVQRVPSRALACAASGGLLLASVASIGVTTNRVGVPTAFTGSGAASTATAGPHIAVPVAMTQPADPASPAAPPVPSAGTRAAEPPGASADAAGFVGAHGAAPGPLPLAGIVAGAVHPQDASSSHEPVSLRPSSANDKEGRAARAH